MKKVNVMLFDGSQDTPRLMTIDDDVDTFHKVINCDTFEGYSNTEIGRKYGLDIYLDGEGKIRADKPRLCGVFVNEETLQVVDTLVGNLLIACHDQEGDTISVFPGAETLLSRKHVVARSNTSIPDVWKDYFGEFETTPYLLVLYC